jgi:uncharacterized caspase-like protein
VIILLSGHGARDQQDQSLYFITHEATMNEPFTGMSLLNLSGTVSRLPVNKKVVLLDMCHAGAVLESSQGTKGGEQMSNIEAVDMLSKGTGTVVFASSDGAQSSLEKAEYCGGNGAFTCALIEGLAGEADTESNPGYVTMSEWMAFVASAVSKKTGGKQTPMVPKLENFSDFPIGKIKD